MDEIETLLQKVLTKAGVDSANPTPINRQLSSIQLVDLVVNLEKSFAIEISADNYRPAHFESLASIRLLVESLRRSKS